jgi:hypothetical protein
MPYLPMSKASAGLSVPKVIYTYLKIITVIVQINAMVLQNTMLSTPAGGHPCPGGIYYPHPQGCNSP